MTIQIETTVVHISKRPFSKRSNVIDLLQLTVICQYSFTAVHLGGSKVTEIPSLLLLSLTLKLVSESVGNFYAFHSMQGNRLLL